MYEIKEAQLTKLKAQVFDLEQNQKHYDSLNMKFRQLQSDYNAVIDEKIRLEYDFRQRVESSNIQINNLRSELENAQINLNDKLTLNKKIFTELKLFEDIVDKKNIELSEKNDLIKSLQQENYQLKFEKDRLQKDLYESNFQNDKTKNALDKGMNENQSLVKVNSEQEFNIKSLEGDKQKLIQRNEELLVQLNQVTSHLTSKEKTLDFNRSKLDDTEKALIRQQAENRELEHQNNRLKQEIATLNNLNQSEIKTRTDYGREVDKLTIQLNERTDQYNKVCYDIDILKVKLNKSLNDSNQLQLENERLKDQNLQLLEQNQRLKEELNFTLDQDRRIKAHLDRKDKIYESIGHSKFYLNNSITSSVERKKQRDNSHFQR